MAKTIRTTRAAKADARGAAPDMRDVPTATSWPTPAPTPSAVRIDLSPSPEAKQSLELRQQASQLVVLDASSHSNALEFVRGAKQLLRKVEDHWKNITRNVDDLKRNLLTLKRKDTEPIEAAIAQATGTILTYENAERRRVQEESDRLRREQEEQQRQERERQLADAEAEAAAIEAQSPNLSAREQKFVDSILLGLLPEKAFERAGYKPVLNGGNKLANTPKIQNAIATQQAAKVLREQTAAKREQPLEYVPPPVVETNLGRASGVSTRTTYSMEVVDPQALIEAFKLNSVDRRALVPNEMFLNQQARDLKEAFESANPGCRLVKRQTIAG